MQQVKTDPDFGATSVIMQITRRIAFVLGVMVSCGSPAESIEAPSGGPYVPTPQAVVDEMLNLARVGPDDFVMDLGSGDGRIVLTAAKRYRARGVGVDIDAELVNLSNTEARRQGVDTLAKFYRQDVLETRISDATVITLYLLPELMHALRDRILLQLKPGTRVVSHDFTFIEWVPDRKVMLELTEKYLKPGSWTSTVYLWVVPAKVEGRWQSTVSDPASENFNFFLTQYFQQFEGNAFYGGESIVLQNRKLEGNRVSFVLPEVAAGRKVLREFSGTVDGDTIHGEVVSQHGTARWTAKRVSTSVDPQLKP